MAARPDEVARLLGVDVSVVTELTSVGVTRDVEPLGAGDVRRLATALAFLDAGFTVQQLADAIERRTLSFEFAETVPAPDGPGSMTLAELAARLGEPVETVRWVYGAFGLPLPTSGTLLSADEEALVSEFLERWRVAGTEATVRAARLAGDGARRVSEGWVALFVDEVSLPAMERYSTYAEYAERVLRPAGDLVGLAPRLLVWLQARHTAHAVLEANLRHFERDLVSRSLLPAPRRRHPVIAFVDLVGFTAMTQSEGDARAVEAAAQLQTLAEDAAAAHGGRVVKLLGDGALLRFEDLVEAATALLNLSAAVAEHAPVGAHLGLERGPVLERDGDVFGGTVNLAARVAAAAGPGEVLAGPDAANGLGDDPRFTLVPYGSREFRGFHSPVPVWLVRRESARRA